MTRLDHNGTELASGRLGTAGVGPRSTRSSLRAVCLLLALVAGAPAVELFGVELMDTVAGTGAAENNGNAGRASEVQIGDPFGVEIGPDGALYITEVRNHRVWKLDRAAGELAAVAGNGRKGYSGDGGPATAAELNEPYEVRFDDAGNMYFVEMQNHLIRKVAAGTGIISTVAGTGQPGYSGDGGAAVNATFNRPHSIALDGTGNLYVADIGNHRIRRINLTTGVIESVAGSDERALPRDGQPAGGRPVLGPRALAIHSGTLWVALREGHSVWRLELDEWIWKHVAGTGRQGFSGDGGPAESATFNGPKGIAVTPAGNVVVVDTENHVIRELNLSDGTIKTIAGRGPAHPGSGGDGGPATQAEMNRPHGICVDSDGTIYIGDTLNHRVRRVRTK